VNLDLLGQNYFLSLKLRSSWSSWSKEKWILMSSFN
jgi:hypothetical protein